MRVAEITSCVLLSVAFGCGGDPDPICDAPALQAALDEASAGDTVRVGNCRVTGSVSVPGGVHLEGLGASSSAISGDVGHAAITLAPGGPATELADLTVESAGPIAILARGTG